MANIFKRILRKLPINSWYYKSKRYHAVQHWKDRVREEGTLTNDHYVRLFTELFDILPEFYQGKSILDIGCGPRGSLEWADTAAERIGLDPFARAYRQFGIQKHKMGYVAGIAEQIPFPDNRFDVVSSFNSIDHVDDLGTALSEINRVLKPGGVFLVDVQLNHHPTVREPVTIGVSDAESLFARFFDVKKWNIYEMMDRSIHGNALKKVPYNFEDKTRRYAIACGVLTPRKA